MNQSTSRDDAAAKILADFERHSWALKEKEEEIRQTVEEWRTLRLETFPTSLDDEPQRISIFQRVFAFIAPYILSFDFSSRRFAIPMVIITCVLFGTVLYSDAQAMNKLAQTKDELRQKSNAYERDTRALEIARTATNEVRESLDVFLRAMSNRQPPPSEAQLRALLASITSTTQVLSDPQLKRAPLYEGDKSRLVKDLPMLDNNVVNTGQRFKKGWVIMNKGTVPWKDRFLMREGTHNASGKLMSEKRVPVPDTAPGEECTIEIDLVAPDVQGPCYAEWKMITAEGRYLFPSQQPLFVKFIVENK